MSNPSELFHRLISEHVTQAFKTLLSEKHLYQSVEIPRGYYDQMAEKSGQAAAVRAAEPSLGSGQQEDPAVAR
jgi:hypothetical protein